MQLKFKILNGLTLLALLVGLQFYNKPSSFSTITTEYFQFYNKPSSISTITTEYSNEVDVTKKKNFDSYKEKNWWRGRDINVTRRNHHPYKGAKVANMTGMIVDPSPERLEAYFHQKRILKSNLTVNQRVLCPSGNDILLEGVGGNEVLQRVRAGLLKSKKFINNETPTLLNNSKKESTRRSKILCMVYTAYFPHDKHSALRSQANTWGRRCDGFFGASNFTDHSIGAIDLQHQGPEAYGNMWQKIRSMWAYAHNHYRDEFDFFYICGDDVYVAVENFRAYVDGPEIERLENGYIDKISKTYEVESRRWVTKRPRPLYLGTPMMFQNYPRPAGGAGYAMNRAALDIFVNVSLPQFLPNATDSREDIFVGGAFCEQGLFLTDTQNALDGGWRFYWAANQIYNYKGKSPFNPPLLIKKYGYELPLGILSGSEQQISFHLKEDIKRVAKQGYQAKDFNYRYEAVLYDFCENSLANSSDVGRYLR